MASYILREWFVTSGLHLMMMACAVALTFPSVLAPALTGDHPQMVVTENELNSIMGAFGLFTFLGYLIAPIIMEKYGRKVTNIFFGICVIIGSATIALATNPILLMVGRAIHGMTLATHLIGCLIVAEYTHPRRRGFHMIIKGVSGGFGDFLCHSLGLTILTYSQTAALAIVPAILSILITLKWPESPQYLARRGRYKECVAAFEWLRGTDVEAKKELQELIRSQKERRPNDGACTRFQKAALSKKFWKPMFITLLMDISCNCTGFLFISSYVTEIIQKIAEDRDKAYYYTLAVDILKIVCVFISSIVIRLFKRRTLLLSSGSIACVLMAVICVLYYLDKVGLIAAKWATPSVFVVYYVIINMVVVPTTIVIQGEIIPFEYKAAGTLVSGIIFMTTTFFVLTYTWTMISILDIHGSFTIFGVICAVCYIFLYFLLPETKDKTLQDIGNEFADCNMVYNEIKTDGMQLEVDSKNTEMQ